MKPSATCRNPDFPGNGMAIHDNFAVVGKLQFNDTCTDLHPVDLGIAGIQRGLQAVKGGIRQYSKFGLIHPVLPFSNFDPGPSCVAP